MTVLYAVANPEVRGSSRSSAEGTEWEGCGDGMPPPFSKFPTQYDRLPQQYPRFFCFCLSLRAPIGISLNDALSTG